MRGVGEEGIPSTDTNAAAPTELSGDEILGKVLAACVTFMLQAYQSQPILTALCVGVPTVLYWLIQRGGNTPGKRAQPKEMPGPVAEPDGEYTPKQLGELTDEQLKAYDGSVPGNAVCVAIKGNIYDCTSGMDFYGPGGPYNIFAGKDASRALARMSFKPEDLNGNIAGLTISEMDVLTDWEKKFQSKYQVVGTVKAA